MKTHSQRRGGQIRRPVSLQARPPRTAAAPGRHPPAPWSCRSTAPTGSQFCACPERRRSASRRDGTAVGRWRRAGRRRGRCLEAGSRRERHTVFGGGGPRRGGSWWGCGAGRRRRSSHPFERTRGRQVLRHKMCSSKWTCAVVKSKLCSSIYQSINQWIFKKWPK